MLSELVPLKGEKKLKPRPQSMSLVPVRAKNFIFPSDPIFDAMNFSGKKNSIWIKTDFLMKA